jgi:hypothetical protein
MADEVGVLENALNSAMGMIEAAAIDARVIVIASEALCIPPPLGSGSCAGGDSNPPDYQHINQTIGSRDALERIIETYPAWAGSLRTAARKFIVVLSDDDSNIPASTFNAAVSALAPGLAGYMFHGIVAGPFSFLDPCAQLAAAPGTVYMELIASTGGTLTNLCNGGAGVVSQGLVNIAGAVVAAIGAGPPPPAPSNHLTVGASAVVMLAKPVRTGVTVVVNADLAGIDLEGTYTGEVSVSGDGSFLATASCTVSTTTPTSEQHSPAVSRLRCTLHRTTRTLFVVYEVFGRHANVPYLGEVRIRRGQEVAVDAAGSIRLKN